MNITLTKLTDNANKKDVEYERKLAERDSEILRLKDSITELERSSSNKVNAKPVDSPTIVAELVREPNKKRQAKKQRVTHDAAIGGVTVVPAVTKEPLVPAAAVLSSLALPTTTNKDETTVETATTDGDWTEVRLGQRYARTSHQEGPRDVLRGAAAPGSTMLCAAERLRYLHLYYVQVGTTADQVRAHLNTICGSDICTVETLKARGNYASFKLGVPFKLADMVLTATNWAEDICVKPWRQNFRNSRKSVSS